MNQENMQWWLGQIIGVIAFTITAFGFFQKDEKKLKTILTISGFFWMANFWFLGSYTSFYITLINTVRQLVSRIMHKSSYEKKLKMTYFFGVITIFGGILSWQSWISFFPTFAATMTTIALFLWEAKKMRLGLLSAEFCWTTNNIYYMNVGGIFANILNIPLLVYHILKKDPITELEKDK